jgi:hypothetical protein
MYPYKIINISIFLFIAILGIYTNELVSHSGRTDKYGGHNNRKTGGYHYHNAGTLADQNNSYKKTTLSPIQKETIIFEGLPDKRIVIQNFKPSEQSFSKKESEKYKVLITKKDGLYYWASRNFKPLSKQDSGMYTIYIAKNGSGYIKIQNNILTKVYLENIHLGLDTITYFGENK